MVRHKAPSQTPGNRPRKPTEITRCLCLCCEGPYRAYVHTGDLHKSGPGDQRTRQKGKEKACVCVCVCASAYLLCVHLPALEQDVNVLHSFERQYVFLSDGSTGRRRGGRLYPGLAECHCKLLFQGLEVVTTQDLVSSDLHTAQCHHTMMDTYTMTLLLLVATPYSTNKNKVGAVQYISREHEVSHVHRLEARLHPPWTRLCSWPASG